MPTPVHYLKREDMGYTEIPHDAGKVREGVGAVTPRHTTQVGMAIDSLLPENYRDVTEEIATLTIRLRLLLGQKAELEALAAIRGTALHAP